MVFEDYLVNLLCALVAVEFMDRLFAPRYSGYRRWLWFGAGCGVYFLTVTGMNLLTAYEGIAGFLYGGAVFAYGLLALRGNWRDFFFCSLTWMGVVVTGTYLVFGAMEVMPVSGDWWNLHGMIFEYASFCAVMVKFLLGRLAILLIRRRKWSKKTEEMVLAGAFLALILVMQGLLGLVVQELSGFWGGSAGRRYGLLLSAGLAALLFLLLLLLTTAYQRLWQYREESLAESYRGNERKRQQEEIRELYRIGRDVNRLHHDMNAGLEVLHLLLCKEKYGEAKRYVEERLHMLSDYPDLPQDTGNEGLNAALLWTVPECREKGIRFHYAVLGRPSRADSMDMGVLMYNLLRNGIEACEKVPGEKVLEITLTEEARRTQILVENSIVGSVLSGNPELKSGKLQKDRHGLGMESICQIVGKYNGEYVCREEEGLFLQSITLEYS